MSRNFEFSAMINFDYSEENILLILENGIKLGCIYKDGEHNIVNIDGVMALLWKLYLQQSPPLIQAKYHETHFYIWFYNRSNKIYLYFWPTHIAWKKRYELSADYGINFYRYQKFMLRLIGNNTIIHFQTYEWFEEPYYEEGMEHDKKIYVKLYTYWAYEIYHHFKINGSMQHITWLDSNKQPIDIRSEDNILENIIYNEDSMQCWYGVLDNIILKFSYIKDSTFIIEPMIAHTTASALDQAQVLDKGLRTTIELFKNTHVLRLITFERDEDIQNINKMDA